jgi:hypothetical protein
MENDRISEKTGMENKNFCHRKEIRKEHLINKLNYINFQDGTIILDFKHLKYNQTFSVRAKPQPCTGDELVCVWPESEEGKTDRLAAYVFSEIKITNGKNMLIVHPEDIRISESGVRFTLPETCLEVDQRRLRRYPCEGIDAQFIQNSVSFKGRLINFSADSFRVEVFENPPQRFFWINSDHPVTLILFDNHNMFYAGECKVLKNTTGRTTRDYVLEPLNNQFSRFKPKDFRTSRHELVPSPYAIFIHPFTQRLKTLRISDLSGSGFSIEEDKEYAMLIPGMILPELQLSYANSLKVDCKAQVVYRNLKNENDTGKVKSGLTILDMDLEDHGKLLALLHQVNDEKYFLGSAVDLDDLWHFFFESGFIYPKKYVSIQTNKENIKAIYQKIYNESPKIARHFIYKEKDRILGHLAMIRFYEKSWMIHHHASNRTFSTMAGINVLDQIGRFINESHSICSVKMDFVFCYFRPENKFPDKIFGGVARNAKDPRKCSLDLFSYFHWQKKQPPDSRLNLPWHIEETRHEDLAELQNYYEDLSGGLMLDALELLVGSEEIDNLIDQYHQLGFKREKFIYSLKKDGILKAVVLINMSDFGLNLSNLTDSIHVFVIDPHDLTQDVFQSMLSALSSRFEQDDIPVLVYPEPCAEALGVPHDQFYYLWVLSAQHLDSYFAFLSRYFKRIRSLR